MLQQPGFTSSNDRARPGNMLESSIMAPLPMSPPPLNSFGADNSSSLQQNNINVEEMDSDGGTTIQRN